MTCPNRNGFFERTLMTDKSHRFIIWILLALILCTGHAVAGSLKLHGMFTPHMVIQRDKPITVWGWAKPGHAVSVRLGQARAQANADREAGRWAVTFPAQPADTVGRTLTVTSGGDTIDRNDILMGDVWVMNGQSNMAFGLGKTYGADLETATAHLPLLRRVGIAPNESYTLQKDLPADRVTGWTMCTPETAGGFSSIGYTFGARLQRALQIPIGIIDNARGGASIESLVPRHTFTDHALASRYLASVEKRRAEFDWDAAVQKLVDKWEKTVTDQRDKGVPEDGLPPRPTRKDLRSWNVPGRSPSDAGACYNGMFGAFKGLRIKGVLFHQGYNNAMGTNCWPKRYRVLMKLMVQGWREDFDDPTLPVGVIGFCAGSIPQTRDNFETWSVSSGSFIRESQRLGLADLEDPTNTAFLAAYDIQIPGLHPHKKQAHAVRAVRWALGRIYGMRINWDTAALVSAEPVGDHMRLTFDKPVMPDDMSMVLEGFSIADQSRKFYMAHAACPIKKDVGIWNVANKNCETTTILVWSPLVKAPVAVRYAWATSPMGNLKVHGKPWLPLPSFRTDQWDWPEHEDPSENTVNRAQNKAMAKEAAQRLAYRKQEEAKHALEIVERLRALGK
jgi:sialate O-acetylesterase